MPSVLVALLVFLTSLVVHSLNTTSTSSTHEDGFLGIEPDMNDSTRERLVIRPPRGGSVVIENYTVVSELTKELTATQSSLSSALTRMNSTETLLFSALNRIAALELLALQSTTTTTTTTPPCKKTFSLL